VIDGFDRSERHRVPPDTCKAAEDIHLFDRFRLHYLKLGRVNRRQMACTPDRFYVKLQHKSRDEIEHNFIAAERILKPHEMARYTYQIFDLQRFFKENFSSTHPEWLAQEQMDRFFLKRLCLLNRDESFWSGSAEESGLHRHLVRYAIMYFDGYFPVRDPLRDFLRDFMNRHRIHRPPERVRMNLAETARLFGVTVEALRKMDCRALTRQYRQLALKHHPDKGGDQEKFVRLSAAYRKLLNRKSRY
jgi:hypothetical protein